MKSALFLLFSLLALALIPRFVTFFAQALVEPSHSFVNYYTAAYLLNHGEDVSRFYDDSWYRRQTARFTPGIEDIYTPHLPTTALMLLPLVSFSHANARLIWLFFNLLTFATAVGCLLWREVPRDWRIPAALILVLLYQPLYSNFRFGQVYALLFALTTLAWYGWRYQRDRLAGTSLSLMIIFKLTGLFLLPFLALEKRWRALLWAVGIILGVALLSLPFIGLKAWLTYLRLIPEYTARPSFAVTAYQSLPGLFKHLFFYHPDWNPNPLWNVPFLASLLPGLASLGMIALTLLLARKARRKSLIFAALIIANLLINPATLEYHYALILFPLLLLCFDAPHWSLPARIILLLAVIFLSADYRYWDAGLNTLLAYPRLSGALLLWALALFYSQPDAHQSLEKSSQSGTSYFQKML